MAPRINIFRSWKLVERENAVRYLMISLFSFIATVSLVRSFLALTGYPQIGNGTLHIAHVLWGGLILFIAAILPLIYLNPGLHNLGAVLSGVGVGLFIDEVGKFITQQNDYFFPAAAPIIYVFFLLVVVLVVLIRRPEKVDGRAELVQALEIIREQLYRPLEAAERAHLELELENIMDSDPDQLHHTLAQNLLDIIHSDPRIQTETSQPWWLVMWEKLEHWLTEKRLSWLLGIGMAILGLVTLKHPLQIWLDRISTDSRLLDFFKAHIGKQIIPQEATGLLSVRIGLEILVGITLLVGVILLGVGKKRQAFDLGVVSLLVSLAVLDMLLFYFEQFSTVLTVLFQFTVLFGLIYYRRRYLLQGK